MTQTAALPQSILLRHPAETGLVWLVKAPLFYWRLGMDGLVNRFLMVMTTTGRKSGRPRRTVIEYHHYDGRTYALAAYGERSQWVKNMQADPHMTLQSSQGTQSVIGRRVTDDDALRQAFHHMQHDRFLKTWVRLLGVQLNEADFIAHKERFYLVTFDPTDRPTPPPQPADLLWVWPVAGIALAAVLLAANRKKVTHAR